MNDPGSQSHPLDSGNVLNLPNRRRLARLMGGMALFLVVYTTLFVWGCNRQEVPVWYALTRYCFAWSAVQSMTFFSASILLIQAVTCRRVFGVASSLLWGVFFSIDFFLLYYSRRRFDYGLLRDANPEYILPFVTFGNVLILLALLGGCAGAAAMLWSEEPQRVRWRRIVVLGGVAVGLWKFGPVSQTRYFRQLHASMNHIDSRLCDRHQVRLSVLRSDPVLHYAREFYRGRIVSASGAGRITSLAGFEEAVREFELPMDQPPPATVEKLPFQRVILIVCESLSGSLLSTHNPDLPTPLMPQLEKWQGEFRSVTGMRGVESSTMQALDCLLCSHPNSDFVDRNHHPHSMVASLGRAGFRTDFLGTWPRLYCNLEEWSRELGFDEFHGYEELMADPVSVRTINGNNSFAPDREMFRRLVNLLKSHRDRPHFAMLMTCDTHIPDGRSDHGDIQYPAPPSWIRDQPTSSLLRSFHRLDEDLRWLLDELRSAGLFDEQTVLVITADHCCPPREGLQLIPGYNLDPHGSLPLVFLSGRELPPVSRQSGSQLDLAPSLLHLLGTDRPRGMWGRSFFDPLQTRSTFITNDQRTCQVQLAGQPEQEISYDSQLTPAQFQLLRLLRSSLIEPPGTPSR